MRFNKSKVEAIFKAFIEYHELPPGEKWTLSSREDENGELNYRLGLIRRNDRIIWFGRLNNIDDMWQYLYTANDIASYLKHNRDK